MFVGGSRGGVNVTRENITVASTLEQILLFLQVRLLLITLAAAVLALWVLLVGRWAGAVLIVAALLSCFTVAPGNEPLSFYGKWDRERVQKRMGWLLFALALGLAMSAAAVFNIWPAYAWRWWDGSMRFEYEEVRAFGYRVFYCGSWLVPPLFVWLRFGLIATTPFYVQPLTDALWALRIESIWPKAREVNMGPASPDSVNAPDGMHLQPMGHAEKPQAAPARVVPSSGPDTFIEVEGVGE
jgi:hypothetical protein